MWGFPQIRRPFWGVPIVRIVVFSGLYWGPPVYGNYHAEARLVQGVELQDTHYQP